MTAAQGAQDAANEQVKKAPGDSAALAAYHAAIKDLAQAQAAHAAAADALTKATNAQREMQSALAEASALASKAPPAEADLKTAQGDAAKASKAAADAASAVTAAAAIANALTSRSNVALVRACAVAASQGDTTLTSAFDSFGIKSAGSTNVATANIAKAYVPWGTVGDAGYERPQQTDAAHLVGLEVTSTLSVGSTATNAFIKQELLNRRGGWLNLYVTNAYRDTKDCGYMSAVRLRAVDHHYIGDRKSDITKAIAATRWFISDAIGVRGITFTPPTSSTASVTTTGAIGTFYAGVGFDGPAFGNPPTSPTETPVGFVSAEVFVSANTSTRKVFAQMFNAKGPVAIYTAGFSGIVNLPGSFAASVDFAQSLGTYGRQHVGSQVMFSIGYNRSAPTANSSNAVAAPGGS